MKIGLFFTYHIYNNFLGTPCCANCIEGGREAAISSVHVKSFSLIVFFSEGSAEVYEQPCACQLVFFQKAVQKCMNSHVHVSVLFF